MLLVIDDILLSPARKESDIADILADRFGLVEIKGLRILRRSLDARNKKRIAYRYRVRVDVGESEAERLLEHAGVSVFREEPVPPVMRKRFGFRPLIVGSGPAGLFCALRLIEAGAEVDVLERGPSVEKRMDDIVLLETRGVLNPESNVLYGEGGAGTYSDGKLTTRIHRGEVGWVMRTFADHGAPGSILYDAKPHIGTDRLRSILENIRNTITRSGSLIHFNSRMDLLDEDGGMPIVIASDEKEFRSEALVLAPGHSARDSYYMLRDRGLAMEKKGFAMGLRVEHPRDLIDEIQFGPGASGRGLPAGDYALAWNNSGTGRGVYSFCMCPGGAVINSSSEEGRLCLNGMSNSLRNGSFSNSALVVGLSPDDFPGDVLAGIEFQRHLEALAHDAGGGGFCAPAQRLTSFMKGRLDATLPKVSYRPSCIPARLDLLLPEWMVLELQQALRHFTRTMKGFITDEAVLLGVETRTSSPVRLLRGDDRRSLSHRGVFPAGEGAGYSGGIVSSAVDGVRTADAIIAQFGR